MLCDSVTVRDGMIYVLGGGIDLTTHDAYPAAFTAELALRVIFFAEELEPLDHAFVIRVTGPGDTTIEETRIVAHREPVLPRSATRAAVNVPLALAFELAEPGRYEVQVAVDGQGIVRLPLEARERSS
jgi:hypothetical protein